MAEHYSRNTVEASTWCTRCNKNTMHRIDGVRKGPCKECMSKLDEQSKEVKQPATAKQTNLF